MPSATANNHPIPGLIPCTAPSSSSAAQGHTPCATLGAIWWTCIASPEAERVGRRVAALQTYLVRTEAVLELEQEVRIERDAALRSDVELRHPAVDAVRVELRVPRRVERIRQVHALAIAAHLDHLRRAVEWLVRRARMRRAPDDAADVHRAHELRLVRIRDVVLPHLTRAPARDVEEA